MKDILFYQLFETQSSTYTYLIADWETKEAAIIDPVWETVERDLKLIRDLNLHLVYVLETHIHADHISGADEIRQNTIARTAISADAGIDCADISLEHGQELLLGNKKITAIATPGHTNACMSYFFEGMIFTGDSLLIRGTGRTDFQDGSASKLYDSITQRLFSLPEETQVYPGHDYQGLSFSTIGLEKKLNPRIGGDRSKEDFLRIMRQLQLATPKKMHLAVPVNLACGKLESVKVMNPQVVSGIPVVSTEDVFENIGRVKIIDVRYPGEFHGALGHINTAQLLPLGSELTKYLQTGNRSEEIVFVCRSGKRSRQATEESIRLGYKFTASMAGGMLNWNERSLPKE
ncbi:MBL fold metallo-hydrolase [Leptospira yasudae]|uniref:MBL fold metallo-hydrolase n=1 Tax=Leptospira yasudae TaxID=2202201 RepID=UPI000E59D0FF|nr:MBL fold metallo-hydrolase [Leptospira yasudae]RHX93269.1 MBL fold metallo-hydrolase [Leptospira yasudae]TGK24639.1 MBL fold metallo-hydrolase [Leptospira yasudae]TGM09476.1 MBL fold metallo-hydrolase [Leptospira yasudae]